MIVKDKVYGNIELKGIYEKIVNCSEFKRLQDIIQTSMAAIQYPELEKETRYEHSIGVYYLMCRALNELEKKLSVQGVRINKEEKEIAKLAALLHDVGHGVNSHLLERITGTSHEIRGIDIVRDKTTQIHKIISEDYGEEFVTKLADFMECVYGDKKIEEKSEIQQDNTIPVKHLIATLISHNIDVDRMDYLIRESVYTELGTALDHSKIISSLEYTIIQNQVLAAIPENKMHLIESMLFERVRNYREIYFSDIDFTANYLFEELIRELRNNPTEVPEDIPEPIRKFLTMEKTELTNQEYMQLTNTQFERALDRIKKTTKNDKIKYLCDYKKVAKEDCQILPTNVNEEYLRELFKKIIPGFPANSRCMFKETRQIKPYKRTKFGSTNIITRQGIRQFEELQHAVNLNTIPKTVFAFNPELLRLEMGLSKKEFEEKYGEIIEDLVKSQTKISQEFERKYVVSDGMQLPYKQIIEAIQQIYPREDSAKYYSLDTYYDTKDCKLLTNGQTLRIREGVKYYKGKMSQGYKNKRITYKNRDKEEQQDFVTKFRAEELGTSIDISEYAGFLQENQIPTELEKTLVVSNNRKLVTFLVNGEKIDISFNVAEYENYVSKQKEMLTTVEIRPRENQIAGRIETIALQQALERAFPEFKNMASNKDIYQIGMDELYRAKEAKKMEEAEER